jgi:hypothetical protein
MKKHSFLGALVLIFAGTALAILLCLVTPAAASLLLNGAPSVPEPPMMLLLGSGLIGLAVFSRKRRKS